MDIGIPTLNSRGKWRKAPFQFGLSTGLSGSGHVPVVYFDLYPSAPTCVVAGIAPNVSGKYRHRSHVFVHAKSDGVVQADRPDADGLIHLEMRLANADGIRQIGGVVAKADAASAP
jgi:hypothetical protein